MNQWVTTVPDIQNPTYDYIDGGMPLQQLAQAYYKHAGCGWSSTTARVTLSLSFSLTFFSLLKDRTVSPSSHQPLTTWTFWSDPHARPQNSYKLACI
jgi:hypothetical protein